MDVRETAIQRLRSAPALDGVFWAEDYNEWRNGRTEDLPIKLSEVFNLITPSDLAEMRKRVAALRNDRAYFGEKHWLGKAHAEIIDEMKRLHPGFSKEVYERVQGLGIFATR